MSDSTTEKINQIKSPINRGKIKNVREIKTTSIREKIVKINPIKPKIPREFKNIYTIFTSKYRGSIFKNLTVREGRCLILQGFFPSNSRYLQKKPANIQAHPDPLP